MGSADWMPRNLDKRVEIVFPLLSENTKKEAMNILKIQLADNSRARIMQPDGSYVQLQPGDGEKTLCAQDYFCSYADSKVLHSEVMETRVFIPAVPPSENHTVM